MKIRGAVNYKKNGFYQIFPLLHIKNGNEDAFVIGFGTQNIAIVFGDNNLEKYKHGGITEWKLNKSNPENDTNAVKDLYYGSGFAQINPSTKDKNIHDLLGKNESNKKSEFNEKLFKYALLFGVLAAGVGIFYLMKKRK
jgi:hypothetical protein